MDQNEFHSLFLQIIATDSIKKNAAEQKYMQLKSEMDPNVFM